MPGVPSCRGCEACRRQKKKCDLSQPSCSRCSRLKIPCVGCGTRRFKFLNRSGTPRNAGFPGSHVVFSSIPPGLSSENALAASRLVSALEATDIRFDLTVYGNFLKEIPSRLGKNEALDAAVYALVTAMPKVLIHRDSPDMYARYADALKSLRVCLSDPTKAVTPETVCAMYITAICQGWLAKRDDPVPHHGEALAYMLNLAVAQCWHGAFEADVIITLSVLVIMESWVNPKIQLNSRIWDQPETLGPRTPGEVMKRIDSLKLKSLARVSVLVKDVSHHLPEIRSVYEEIRADCRKTKQTLSQFPLVTSSSKKHSATALTVSARKLHLRFQVGHSILLIMVLMLNTALRAYDPHNISLTEECAADIDDTIHLVEQTSQYRPLGSSSMPLNLMGAWAMSEDVAQRTRLEELLTDWETDFSSTKWLDLARQLRSKLRRVRPNSEKEDDGDDSPRKLPKLPLDAPELCHIV